jgi:hypothetical protein
MDEMRLTGRRSLTSTSRSAETPPARGGPSKRDVRLDWIRDQHQVRSDAHIHQLFQCDHDSKSQVDHSPLKVVILPKPFHGWSYVGSSGLITDRDGHVVKESQDLKRRLWTIL